MLIRWKTRNDARIKQSMRVHKALFHLLLVIPLFYNQKSFSVDKKKHIYYPNYPGAILAAFAFNLPASAKISRIIISTISKTDKTEAPIMSPKSPPTVPNTSSGPVAGSCCTIVVSKSTLKICKEKESFLPFSMSLPEAVVGLKTCWTHAGGHSLW